MSFDTVRLPAAAIADLYRQSLVVLDDVHQTRPKNKPQPTPPVMVEPSAPVPSPVAVQQPAAAEAVIPVLPKPQPTIRYTGGFGKKISVVVRYPGGTELPSAGQEMLNKLMGACKLTAADFAIINTAVNQPAAQELWRLMPAQAMLLFGVDYNEVGIPFTQAHFQVKQWNDAWFLSAPPLSQFLGVDTPELKALKRELWNGLQKIFLGK